MDGWSELPRVLGGPAAIVVETRARTVEVAGVPVVLTRLSFNLLVVLLYHRGEVLTHGELADLAWSEESTAHHGAIQTGIYRLRRVLNAAGAQDVIHAIRGVGYTIDGPVQRGSPLLERTTLESALRAAPIPTMLVDAAGWVALANDAIGELTGFEVEKLERLPSWLSVIAQRSWPAVEAVFGSALRGSRPTPVEAFTARIGGRDEQPIRVQTVPISGPEGVSGVLITLSLAVVERR